VGFFFLHPLMRRNFIYFARRKVIIDGVFHRLQNLEEHMGIFDKIAGEFIDIIEWTEPSQNQVLAYRFPRHNNEIKMNAKLTVREGQTAVFINEGKLADVFQPGMYTLTTQNMPILSTLKGWKYGFSSPFKAEVYFISMRNWTDQKWGTQNPMMMRDPEFGVVRIRAFGTYGFHVSDPATFLKQLVVTDPSFEAYEISNQLRNTIVARFVDTIGQAKMPVLDLAGNYDKISRLARETITPDLAAMGLALTQFYIENISLPPEVEQAIDARAKVAAVGDIGKYTQYQTAQSIPIAAANGGGVAGIGAGIAVGQQMAAQMGGALNAANSPPPMPGAAAAFFIGVNGQQQGPFDAATLAAKMRDGSFTPATLVWKQGMPSWVAASSVPDLASLFAAVPPPLPK
jgi:membrane protease subunit (stomatin/prohibitin family)